ncbi:MAG: O-antigen ligase family protein [Alphaproteobacteria bacterium]
MHALQRYLPAYAILSVAAVLIVPVAALQPLWLSIIAALAAFAAILGCAGRGEWPRLHRTVTWLLAALVVWGAISMVWSIVPDRSASQALRLFLIAGGTIFLLSAAVSLDPAGRKTLESFVIAGVAFGLLFMLFELATGGLVHGALNGFEKNPVKNLFELNRASSVISIAAWVAIVPVWRRFGWLGAAVLILVSGFVISQLQPGSPFLALIVGAGFFAVAWFLPRLAFTLLLATVAASLIMIPFIAELTPIVTDLVRGLGYSEFSQLHRMAIWEFASERVLAQPIIGWGLDAARSVGSGQIVSVDDAPNLGSRAVDALPLHPHNALIQAWLELGVPGALILAGLFASAVLAIRRGVAGTFERSAACAAVAAAFVNAELSFGIWQGWWLSCLALFAIVMTALVTPTRAGVPPDPA